LNFCYLTFRQIQHRNLIETKKLLVQTQET